MKRKRERRDGERGQVLVLAALTMAAVIGFAAASIDTGFILHTRTELQKDVDAMALAGAQALCGKASCEPAADSIARDYGKRNRVTSTDTVVIQFGRDCDGGTSANYDMITVRLTRYQRSFLARVVGYEGGNVRACATARKFQVGEITGVRPFGLEEQCFNLLKPSAGTVVTLKFDSSTTRTCDSLQGNYAAIGIDGGGSSNYRETIKFGSKSPICAWVVPGCESYLFATETGNMIGPTKQGLDYIFANTPSVCNTYDQVWDASAKTLKPACDPWRGTYSTTYGTTATRLFTVPIVKGMWDSGGKNTIKVMAFAAVFVTGFGNNCTGNSCDVKAIFLDSDIRLPGSKKAALTPLAGATMVSLVK